MILRRLRFRDSIPLILTALLTYALMGVFTAPFHGDEATIISMGGDYYRFRDDPDSLRLRLPPPDAEYAAAQDLRLLNGVIAKYLIGGAWSFVGVPADLNKQWLWGADWDFNRANGHIPSERLLILARLTSALCLALSILIVYACGQRCGGEWAGVGAALVYTLMPAVLLNGRRAMHEGSFLLGISLVILATLIVLARQGEGRRLWRAWLYLGMAGGFALATKHTAALLLMTVYPLLVWGGRRTIWRTLVQVGAAAGITVVIFFALNPTWWDDPIRAAQTVLTRRDELMRGQVAAFGGFQDGLERLTALVGQPFGGAQYFEIAEGWRDWLAEPIQRYEGVLLGGLGMGLGGGMILLGVGVFGVIRVRFAGALALLWIAAGTAILLLATNPLAWQRYYLPLSVPYALLIGVGWRGEIVRLARRKGG